MHDYTCLYDILIFHFLHFMSKLTIYLMFDVIWMTTACLNRSIYKMISFIYLWSILDRSGQNDTVRLRDADSVWMYGRCGYWDAHDNVCWRVTFHTTYRVLEGTQTLCSGREEEDGTSYSCLHNSNTEQTYDWSTRTDQVWAQL